MGRPPKMVTTREIKCPVCGAEPSKGCRSVNGKLIADTHRDRRLISINEAVRLGQPRLRKPIWANALDHIKLDLIDGSMGPWIHLYAPFNQECNGRDPVDILALTQQDSFDTQEFTIYDGPLPNSEEYLSAAAKFDGVLGEDAGRFHKRT